MTSQSLDSVRRYGREPLRPGLLLLTLVQSGCGAGWHNQQVGPPGLAPRQQAQVWSGGKPRQWHGIRVTADSVSGVLYTQPPECDSCRVALARNAVDSIRLGNPSAGLWKSLALGGAITLGAALLICRFESSCTLSD
jgi:hypothetical protein